MLLYYIAFLPVFYQWVILKCKYYYPSTYVSVLIQINLVQITITSVLTKINLNDDDDEPELTND